MRISAKRIGKGKAPQWGKRAKKELKDAQQEAALDLLKEYEKVVADWDHKPKFVARVKRFLIFITAEGRYADIWRFVNWGTKRHKIRAKNAKALSFFWGGPGSYQPKTRPIGRFGGPGTVSGGEQVAFTEVDHPGSKARRFDIVLTLKFVPKYTKRIAQGIRRIFRK